MNRSNKWLSTHPAVIAVWAALIAVSTLISPISLIGIGGTFSVNMALLPLAGVFFGPVAGAVCAAIGAFLGQFLNPSIAPFGPLTFLIPTAGALAAGFAVRRKWYVSIGMILLASLVWYLFPLGREVWFFPLIWVLGLLAGVIGWLVAPRWFRAENRVLLFIAVFLAALVGTIVDHSIGSVWALIMFRLPREVWLAVLFVAPVERLLFSLGAAIIGTPLIVALPRVGVLVGPQAYEEEEEDLDEFV